jgi:hypothetical protein
MLIGQQPGRFRLRPNRVEELARDVALEQPVAILREGDRVPNRVIHLEPDEPPEQQVVLQLLNQQGLAAHRVQCLQQQRPQQMLRRDRGPSFIRIQSVERRDKLASASSVSRRLATGGPPGRALLVRGN